MPVIRVVFDVPKWTWHHRAMDLATFAPPEYTVHTHKESTFLNHLKDPGFVSGVDAVFFMGWASCPIQRIRKAGCKRLVSLVTSAGPAYRAVNDGDWNTWIVTGSRNYANAHTKLPRYDAIIVVNRFLADACRNHTTRPIYLIPSGVNTDAYSPSPSGREQHNGFRVGWCANINGTHTVKGYKEILEPLIAETPEWKWCVNTRNHRRAWTREQMVDWYRTLDAFVCTSICEGTPSPVFEAASCGVPIVSTDVGCVRDWQLPHDLHLIAPAYQNAKQAGVSREHLRASLSAIANMPPAERTLLGFELRSSVCKLFDYRVISPRTMEALCQTNGSER